MTKLSESIKRELKEALLYEARVGAFYYAYDHLWSDDEKVRDADEYGGFINYASHASLYDDLKAMFPKLFSKVSYDYFPRGRVVFNKATRKFIIYMDPKLNKPKIINDILDQYDIPSSQYVIDTTDEHYVSDAPAPKG